ncbi:arsenate reductase family protein [Enterococcus canis]|uniref:arsenate reductase family protein n=1 Tax=Enterococcus canis TaxID=214095 RepID=UPI00083277C5|nr:arsenate reductase family protein [Enterococcus canis]
MYTLYWYPKCSTCKKAKAWLEKHNVAVQVEDMVENPPASSQLLQWMQASDLPVRRFFNTSGIKYREQGWKDKVNELTPEEAATILSKDGMLIKRPILVKDGELVAIGFKETDYEGAK